jgi:ABC-type transport system involved in multi-copper enzyme maturation permease subunit
MLEWVASPDLSRALMNLPAGFFVIRCLVRDTFRQSLAGRTFWMVLGLSVVIILLCFSAHVEGFTARTPKGEIEHYGSDGKPYTGMNPLSGRFTLLFGLVRFPQFRDGPAMVEFIQALLAKWGASAIGLLLILLWTSGFLPDFLRPDSASVLLAKPVPRWALLVGKYLGVMAFVAFHLIVFVVGTWIGLGVSTGYWSPGYLLTIPLVLLQFAILYSFSVFVAVWVPNPIVCILGTVLFWSLCAGVNNGRNTLAVGDERPGPVVGGAAEVGYWLLPKPVDLGFIMDEALHASRHFATNASLNALNQRHQFLPSLSLLTSLLSVAVVLALAARRFGRLDY